MKRAILLCVVCLLVVWAARSIRSRDNRCDLDTYDLNTNTLDLKDCGLETLPASITRFRRLSKLDLGRNALTSLPDLPESIEVRQHTRKSHLWMQQLHTYVKEYYEREAQEPDEAAELISDVVTIKHNLPEWGMTIMNPQRRRRQGK